jgi:hypothetical protein
MNAAMVMTPFDETVELIKSSHTCQDVMHCSIIDLNEILKRFGLIKETHRI